MAWIGPDQPLLRRCKSGYLSPMKVTDRPYRFTRNPMYTGLTVAYLGGAALLDSGWPIIVLPIVLFVLVRTVVSREETYLNHAFGADHGAYTARVRRWL